MTLTKMLQTTACALAVLAPVAAPALAGDVIQEWASAQIPPPPALKPVTVDVKTTALLMMDFNDQTCSKERRPRCIASLPAVKTLVDGARTAGATVIYTLGGGGKPEDFSDKSVAPKAGEPVLSAGPNKFIGTELEKILKDKGIKTVIAVGTAANGAVLFTAGDAALRGFKVIVPVDGMSAETVYIEQYSAWHLVNAPRVSTEVTLTRIADVKF